MLDRINSCKIFKQWSDSVIIRRQGKGDIKCKCWQEVFDAIGIDSYRENVYEVGNNKVPMVIRCGKYIKPMQNQLEPLLECSMQDIYDIMLDAASIFLELKEQDQRDVMVFNRQTITKEV